MEKKQEYYCEYCPRGNANENLNTALFTAGMVLLMVCLKRASLLFLVEQWRAWVFLVLNIVLLAIFVSSGNPTSTSSTQGQESKNINDEEMKKRRGNCKGSNGVEACKKGYEGMEIKLEKEVVEEYVVEPPKLSKEELNERVEAFIAMFRQHLALDAKKRKGHEPFI